jgi:two-component system, cell cycle response regulator
LKKPTIDEIIASPRLPSLPAVAVQIIDLVQQPQVSLPDLAKVISNDAALTGKILKTANSSYYARSRSVSKLSDALMVLGLRRVKTLALGFSLVADLRKGADQSFDNTSFWQRSLLAATAARAIAAVTASGDQEEAFLCGLTHCLGVLALNQAVGPEYQELLAAAAGDYWRLLEVERTRLGFSHAELGAALGEKWNLPPQMTASLRHYPYPDQAPEAQRDAVRFVHVGALAADVFVGSAPSEALVAYRDRCLEWFHLPAEEAESLLEQINGDAIPMRALLQLPDTHLSVSEILAQANEALEQFTFEAQDESARLEEERARLAAEATTDGLTGVANRRHFDEFVGEAYATAIETNTPLSILMVDLDHFKKINDTYGHQGGDVVLKTVAATLNDSVRASDVVARYGGEEFVVVVPDTGAAGAFGLARRLRTAIEALELKLGVATAVKVTASFGVASLDHKEHTGIADVIREADGALYEAKAAGRNTVRLAKRKEEAAAA